MDEVQYLRDTLPRCENLYFRFWNSSFFDNHPGFNWIVDSMFSKNWMGTEQTVARAARARTFMMKPFLHDLLPLSVDSILVLDSDMLFRSDVRRIFQEELTAMRASGALFGLAPELQPEYLEAGMGQGYNGGLQLWDLAAVRSPKGDAYRAFLDTITWGATRWPKGVWAETGDQVLFTLANKLVPGVVKTLPCGWNLNLCQYFVKRQRMGEKKFPEVHIGACPPPIHVVHGNGATLYNQGWVTEGLPLSDWEMEDRLRGIRNCTLNWGGPTEC